jgi:hypothetical protein
LISLCEAPGVCEIWLVIVLSRVLAEKARSKGHTPHGYVAMLVVLWICGEIGGLVFGFVVTEFILSKRFGDGEPIYVLAYVFGLLGALMAVGISFGAVSLLPDYGTQLRRGRLDRYDDRDDDRRRPDDRRSSWDKGDKWDRGEEW